ncbi:MAG: hypothetical protein ACI4SF_00495 [Oscillospiraceae bacterium]
MKKAVLFLVSFILYGGMLALTMYFDVLFQEGNKMSAVLPVYTAFLIGIAGGFIPVKRKLNKHFGISSTACNACVISAAVLADFIGWMFLLSLTAESYKKMFPDGGFLAGLGLGLIWLECLAGTALLIVVIIAEAVVKAVIRHKNKN